MTDAWYINLRHKLEQEVIELRSELNKVKQDRDRLKHELEDERRKLKDVRNIIVEHTPSHLVTA